jgi:hypothetical protein
LTPRNRLWLCLALAAVLSGCTAPEHDPRILAPIVPGDFALQVSVRGPGESDLVSREPAQYLVECNRNLRVALGPGATGRYFPKLTCVLTYEQYEALYQWVSDHHLAEAATTPGALAAGNDPHPGLVVYHVEVTALAHVSSFNTTPDEAPAVTHLILMLARMSGRQPADSAPAPTSQETAP